MKPYGIKPGQWRDEEGGPTTKHASLSSKTRTRGRRQMHKTGRRGARKAIKQSIIDQIG